MMCPSTILASLWPASSWKISPRCLRSTPKIRFFLRFGIKTTWYLQSHLVWLRLWYSFMYEPPSLGGERRFTGDRRIGQTRVSPPAEPGAYLKLSYQASHD